MKNAYVWLIHENNHLMGLKVWMELLGNAFKAKVVCSILEYWVSVSTIALLT